MFMMAFLLAMVRWTSKVMPSLLSLTTSVWLNHKTDGGETVVMVRVASGRSPTVANDPSTVGYTRGVITAIRSARQGGGSISTRSASR